MAKKKRSSKPAANSAKNEPRLASAQEVLTLLGQRTGEVYEALNLTPDEAQLTLPTDGKGLRIKANVRPDLDQKVPRSITVPVEDDLVKVPVEVSEEFQDFQPLPLKARPRRG